MAGATFASVALRFHQSNADTGTFPTRFLFVYTSAGRDVTSRCTGNGSSFTLGADLAALEPWKNKMLVVDGLKIPPHTGEEHPCGRASMLTGRPAATNSLATGASFDRYLANKLSNGLSVYTALQAPGGDIDIPISWHAANTPNEAITVGPQELMSKIFKGVAPPSSNGAGPRPGVDDEVDLNTYLMSEVKRLERIADASEVEKLQLHLAALEQIRASMGGGTAVTGLPVCTTPPAAGAASDMDRTSEILAHAFACGAARVGVVRIGSEEPHHQYSHWHDSADYRGKLQQIERDEAAHVAKLLAYLDSFKEGSGTMLDNIVVVWSSEVSGSHGNDIHGTEGMPLYLFGSLGRRLKTGQRITVSQTNNELYRALAKAMGVSDPTDFGDPARPGILTDILA